MRQSPGKHRAAARSRAARWAFGAILAWMAVLVAVMLDLALLARGLGLYD